MAHQVSQDLKEVSTHDLAFDRQIRELGCEFARDQLRVIQNEVLDEESQTEAGTLYSIFILSSASHDAKERLKEHREQLFEVFCLVILWEGEVDDFLHTLRTSLSYLL